MYISARRERIAGEIVPVFAEHSRANFDNVLKYGAARSIDLDFETGASPVPGSDGTTWIKVTLDQLYCVDQVMRYYSDGNPCLTWTCSQTDCTDCEGKGRYCNRYSLTVSSVRAVPDNLPSVTDYRYGDTVKLAKIDSYSFEAYEIAIIGKKGEITHW